MSLMSSVSYATPHTAYDISIGGMTCVNCSSGVEMALKKLSERNDNSIKEYSVNLVMHSGRVVVEDGKGVDGDVIVDTIEGAGYECKVNRSATVEKSNKDGMDEVRGEKGHDMTRRFPTPSSHAHANPTQPNQTKPTYSIFTEGQLHHVQVQGAVRRR